MAEIVNQGHLLPDALILRVIREHFMRAHSEGQVRGGAAAVRGL